MRSGMGLDVETWVDRGRLVVEVSGELDALSAPRLREDLARIDAPRPLRIAVLMGGVEFIDSSGVGVLIGAAKRARASGGRVALVGCSAHVDRMLRRMALHKVFGLHPGLDAGLAWLDGAAR